MDAYGDKAFDRFTGWALRNVFDFSKDLEVVLVSITPTLCFQADEVAITEWFGLRSGRICCQST
jgi:hypothetical protein